MVSGGTVPETAVKSLAMVALQSVTVAPELQDKAPDCRSCTPLALRGGCQRMSGHNQGFGRLWTKEGNAMRTVSWPDVIKGQGVRDESKVRKAAEVRADAKRHGKTMHLQCGRIVLRERGRA